MTTQEKELLSALVDGELQGEELQEALQVIETNAHLRTQWQRYQFNRDVLQGNSPGFQVVLSQRVAQVLQGEPAYVEQKLKAQVVVLPKQFWKQAAGLAMAALIGALAVVGVISQPQHQTVPMPPIAVVDTPNVVVQQVGNASTGNRWTVGEPEVEARLNIYLVDHHEYTGASGVFSYARVVSYEAGQ